MPKSLSELASEVTATPVGDLISSVGQGVAEAQAALDAGSLQATLDLYSEGGDAMVAAMRAIGYRPTFYALPETTGEITVALRMGVTPGQGTGTPAASTGGKSVSTAVNPQLATSALRLASLGTKRLTSARLYATPVDGGYANRFSFRSDLSAKVSFKIVPVPAPEAAEDIRRVPDLTGRTLDELVTVADVLGFDLMVKDAEGTELAPDEQGDFIVSDQEPAADTYARAGDLLSVTVTKAA